LTKSYIPDDTENDLCIAVNDSAVFWGLWRRKIWMEIWVRLYLLVLYLWYAYHKYIISILNYNISIFFFIIDKISCFIICIVLSFFLLFVFGIGAHLYDPCWSPILLCACRYPYLACILNFSQTWALYCLVQFYSVTKDKLEPIKPLAKFVTFKSIVFLTWWQGVAVAFLFSMGAFKGSLAQELKTRIQDYIICIEVLYSCISHY